MNTPHLEFELPTSHYHQTESIPVVMLPAQGGRFEVQLAPASSDADYEQFPEGNRVIVKPGLSPGKYFLKARWRDDGAAQSQWSNWSPPLHFSVHPADADLSTLWETDHRLSLMLEKSPGGAITLIDPEAEPPASVGLAAPHWFAAPVYEGRTPLVNEEPEYYQDPLAYYFSCIDQLIASGARFVTWHDLLEGRYNQAPLEILLQFDVDGGPKSMRRLYEGLIARNVRATIMLHYRGHHWYPYELEDAGIEWIKEAESAGWAIGYHNNALSQVMADNPREPDASDLQKARDIFERDVRALREYFNVRTYTHHGGNVYNLKVDSPPGLNITGVDRANSPELWKSIKSMFSDGGFVSRPCTLKQKVHTLHSTSTVSTSSTSSTSNIHFLRNHPFKYGNYTPPADALPRFTKDFPKAGLDANDSSVLDLRSQELVKERRWLQQRQKTRTTQRLAYLRLEKPISSRFKPYTEVQARVEELRKRRRASFLRLYPWAQGDPRVFWWRMLDAWAPKGGELLNVGALPPDQKDEHDRFLSPDVVVKDVDIDPGRSPDFTFDICNAPQSMNGRFSGVMLFGLPYFASPSMAVAACARLTRLGGVGVFGFVADTHPARGSVWHPSARHLWRKEKEPLENIGLKANLWAFDQDSLVDLFRSWKEYQFEFMGHYWFVVAKL
jgi:hypothetical protein